MKDTARPWILGIASSYHNGAVCLLRGDEMVVAVQEERLLRAKRADLRAGQESLAVRYCLDYAGIDASALTAVGVCSIGDNEASHDVRLSPQLRTEEHGIRVVTLSHHLGHAAGVFATSGFESSTILVVDGVGSPARQLTPDERGTIVPAQRARHDLGNPEVRETISLYRADGTTISPLAKHVACRTEKRAGAMRRFFSLGSLFLNVGAQIFGDSLDGAGKVMGLAPFGQPTLPTPMFFSIDGDDLVFSDAVPARFAHADRWPQRRDEYADLAASVQVALEDAVLWLVSRARTLSEVPRLCYAGGVALNSVANERVAREGGYEDLFIMPAAEDSGTAIGAAYYALWQTARQPARRRQLNDGSGRVYTLAEIDQSIAKCCAVEARHSGSLSTEVAAAIADGAIVGWFQGGSELGPRALGQRSILADPRRRDVKDVLNSRVKFRESFRPYAPAILAEHVDDWFEDGVGADGSPFMLRVMRFRQSQLERVPGVVHVDGTGRVQTVTPESNPQLHALLTAFHQRTGVPILLNTSFNTAGEPIVETPDDALVCLAFTDLDLCVLGDRVVRKAADRGTPLDWLPYLCCEWLSEHRAIAPRAATPLDAPSNVFVSACYGRRPDANSRETGPPFDHAQIVVNGRWGPVVHVLSSDWLRLLRLMDGQRSGRDLLALANRDGAGLTEPAFQRRLGALTRAAIVGFHASHATVPGRRDHATVAQAERL